jgi:general secretion pathway protein D
LLGALFRHQSTQKVKRDLMVFLHPVILRDGEQSSAVSSEKYSYIRASQIALKEKGVNLMSDDVAPVLPEMKEFLELPPPYEDTNNQSSVALPPTQAIAE